MTTTYLQLTAMQLRVAAERVERDGIALTQMTVHPYSGVATLSGFTAERPQAHERRAETLLMIEPDGTVSYDVSRSTPYAYDAPDEQAHHNN